jgi:hypothetical protein
VHTKDYNVHLVGDHNCLQIPTYLATMKQSSNRIRSDEYISVSCDVIMHVVFLGKQGRESARTGWGSKGWAQRMELEKKRHHNNEAIPPRVDLASPRS